MANRIVGNVYIIDTVGDLDGPDNLKINSIAFWSTDSTGALILCVKATSANELVKLNNNQNQAFTVPLHLGGVYLKDVNVKTLTAGTAWLYLI